MQNLFVFIWKIEIHLIEFQMSESKIYSNNKKIQFCLSANDFSCSDLVTTLSSLYHYSIQCFTLSTTTKNEDEVPILWFEAEQNIQRIWLLATSILGPTWIIHVSVIIDLVFQNLFYTMIEASPSLTLSLSFSLFILSVLCRAKYCASCDKNCWYAKSNVLAET